MSEAMEIDVRVKRLHPDAQLPRYAHAGVDGDLAADLYSIEDVELFPGDVVAIATGIVVELPDGFGAIIEDRSGLALQGLTTLAGVVDTGYRGEIKIVITNVTRHSVKIRKGDRIAQLRIVHRIQGRFSEVTSISPSDRQTNGFGSTGS